MNEIKNKQTGTKKTGKSRLKKAIYSPIGKIQVLLNESQDLVVSKAMRLLHKNLSIKNKKTIKNKKAKGNTGKMKKFKTTKILMIAAILVIPILFGWKINDAAQKNSAQKRYSIELSEGYTAQNPESSLNTQVETKKWHIINRFVPAGMNDTLDCNNSVYEFNKDSVLVINDFIAASNDNEDFVQEEFYRK